MNDTQMIAVAVQDKKFTDWVERYFGFGIDEIPMNNAVLIAVAVSWVESKAAGETVKTEKQRCDKCGGNGSYHCQQMLGTVECECGIVKVGE